MILHPDGRVEGTIEELLQFHSVSDRAVQREFEVEGIPGTVRAYFKGNRCAGAVFPRGHGPHSCGHSSSGLLGPVAGDHLGLDHSFTKSSSRVTYALHIHQRKV